MACIMGSPVQRAAVSLTALLASACAADATEAAAHGDSAAELEDDFKGCPADIPVFEPGLRAAGERFALRVEDAMPAQPERYTNSWTVALEALDGSVAPDAALTRGETFMPVHGHDGRVRPAITALSDAGQFRVADLSFTMRGPWEARFWLQSPQGEDYVVFHVCVAR
jgi:hypothetical protein